MEADVISWLKSEPILKVCIDVLAAADMKAYLVGGALRNLVLSQSLGFDFDIVVEGDVRDAANLVAQRLIGSPFLLDKRLGSYRVVIKDIADLGLRISDLTSQITNRKSEIHIDLSTYKGKDIFEDLKNRDFTINAMALDINGLFKKKADLIDIFNGQTDAKNKTIRMLKPEIFDDDPLRLLRAVRLSAQYGLIVDKATEKRIKEKANLLAASSWERIRDEFFSILACKESVDHLKKLYELSLLQEILPEIRGWEDLEGYNLISHAFKTLEQGEALFHNLKVLAAELADSVESYFQTPVGNISKKGLFKLVLLSHDAGKPITMKKAGERIRFIGHEVAGEAISKRMGKRLKISRAAAAFVARLVRNHHRVFNLAFLEKLTERSKAHMFRVLAGEDGIALVLLSLADARATRNGDDPELTSFVSGLINFYYKVYAVNKPNPILKGSEVMKIFNIPEGVMVGRILKILAEAEGEGIIKSKRDAVKLIKNWLKKSKEEW
ncbi:MAG: CCA tRNA nucleotidyltransferase [Deltaproteobacteria bacterium]|nr:CCA tRNA nucleotidyltransferase [Deltaproteobacteria bacterium]